MRFQPAVVINGENRLMIPSFVDGLGILCAHSVVDNEVADKFSGTFPTLNLKAMH